MKELPIRSLPGIPVLIVALLASAAAAWLFFTGMGAGGAPGIAVHARSPVGASSNT